MSEWVSVEKKIPLEGVDVLVVDDSGDMQVSCCFLSEGKYCWEDRDDQGFFGEVTHWMPLPALPTEKS